jgi:hypothetical protein
MKYTQTKSLQEHIKYARTFKSRVEYTKASDKHPEGYYKTLRVIMKNFNCPDFKDIVGWKKNRVFAIDCNLKIKHKITISLSLYSRYMLLPDICSTEEAQRIWKEDYITNTSFILKKMKGLNLIKEDSEITKNSPGRRMKIYKKVKNLRFEKVSNRLYAVV